MHDALVIGAGPAGASAAIALANAGIRDVLVIDRAAFPRDKTCGSGLSPNAIALAGQLGVGEELRRRAVPVLSVKIVTPGGRSMVLAGNAAAVVLLRRDFDDLLVRRAQELGARFQGGVRAVELLREGGRVAGVRLAGGSELRARFVLCADGAHSVFSIDPRPAHSISTLMGWWEHPEFVPGRIEMIFDRNLSPLYGWLFPESETRVNIGICIDGPVAGRGKRNVREVFERFLEDHFAARLRGAEQVGKLQGHPIVWTTFIDHCAAPGVLYVGEAARVTHNATGEGISQAMQSGIYAAETVADVLGGRVPEEEALRAYLWKHRRRFTPGFLVGHLFRGVVRTPILDGVAAFFDQPLVRRAAVRLLGSALAGTSVSESRGEA